MFPLPSEDRRRLLELARRAVAATARGIEIPDAPKSPESLRRNAGAFVTLRRLGELRGCVGQVEATRSLAEQVIWSAAVAAREDPRFDPVRPEEVAEIAIEISILSQLAPVRPEEIEIGRHGLYVSRGRLRGVLLPQVAKERAWSVEEYLRQTCWKAGLGGSAWSEAGTRIEAFTAEVFSDEEFASRGEEKAG